MSSLARSRKLFVTSAGVLGAIAILAASGCGSSKADTAAPITTTTTAAAAADDGASITLLESAHDLGPWSRRISIRLGREGVPVQFYVCAVRSTDPPAKPCAIQFAAKLPAGATLRLEQQPVGPGAERADSPGWGLVGTSEDGFMKTTLSDFVSADNKPGRVTYRVTERDPSGRILATSNRVVINWHR
jgi:hypothetical protein